MMHSSGDNAITGDCYTVDIGRSELASARSPPNVRQECAPSYDEEEAVWSSIQADTNGSYCGRRRTWAIALVSFGLIIAIVAMAVAGENVNSISSEVEANSTTTPITSKTESSPATTETPPTTTSWETSLPRTTPDAAATNETLPTNASNFDSTTTTDGSPPTNASDTAISTTTSEVSSRFNCDEGHLLEQDVKLEPGRFICSSSKEYRFGMDETGDLVFGYERGDDIESIVLYNGEEGNYFKMLSNGHWKVYDSTHIGTKTWVPLNNYTISSDPYLYLQNDGKLMLNWDHGGEKERRNVLHVYDVDTCSPNYFLCD